MSAESVTLILPTLCVPPVGYLWPLSSCYCLERVFSRPVLLMPNLTSHTDVACARPHCFIPATWPPNFHFRLWATATVSFMLFVFLISAFVTLSLPTTCSFLRSIFCWQDWSFYSFSLSAHVWVSHDITGSTQESRKSFFISVFWNILESIRSRLLKWFQAIAFFLFPSMSCSAMISVALRPPVLWDIFKSFFVHLQRSVPLL